MKTALVTGASRGIGKSIALKLLENNYFVHGTYNSGDVEVQEILKTHKNIKFHQCNFQNRAELYVLIEKLKSYNYDCIVNNAGIIEFEDFENFDMSVWDKHFDINLNTPLIISTALQNNINKNGAIINISSLDGCVGSFASMAYSASKAALINLTKSLANNFGSKGIRVNAVAPGWINTGMSTPESMLATKITPLARNGLPEEVAEVVVFLADLKSSFVTGETIVIDGGYQNVDYIMLQEAKISH